MLNAYSIKVRGVVQGVGFRPFVYRLARTNGLTGWVLNEEEGVEIHLEGEEKTLRVFIEELKTQPPPAASSSSAAGRTGTPGAKPKAAADPSVLINDAANRLASMPGFPLLYPNAGVVDDLFAPIRERLETLLEFIDRNISGNHREGR